MAGRNRLTFTQRAFTLVELLVVIGIIMMLIAISAPLITTMAQNQALTGAVEITKVEFMQLRERAATSGMPVVAILEHWTDPVRLMSWSPLYDEENERWIWMLVSMVRFPERVWAHDDWLDDVPEMNEASTLPTGLPYADAVQTLLLTDLNNDGYYSFPSPPPDIVSEELDDGTVLRRDRRRCYALVFLPDGTVQPIGRPNVPITELHSIYPDEPNGDIIITNGRETLYMCINPATARIEWVKTE